jgi:rRNA processing protein Krr1/Pno1
MPKTDTSKLFAAYPHLAVIGEKWGTREARRIINDLMNDSRGGERQGFPAEHASTIMSLLMEHDREFPNCDDSSSGQWWQQEQERRGVKE